MSLPGDGHCCLIRAEVILCSHPISTLCFCAATELTCAPHLCIFNLLNRKEIIAVKRVPLQFPDFSGGSAELPMQAHPCPASRETPRVPDGPWTCCQPLTGGCTATPVSLLWKGGKVLFCSIYQCLQLLSALPASSRSAIPLSRACAMDNRLCFLLTEIIINNGQNY